MTPAAVADEVAPLAQQYVRPFEHPWRIAIVSLFNLESMSARAMYTFVKACGYDVDLILLKEHAVKAIGLALYRLTGRRYIYPFAVAIVAHARKPQ